jgi:molybdenum cofactor guanylyltransferase
VQYALRQAVTHDGVRSIQAFTNRRAAEVEWPAIPADPFLNVNTQEDLAEANSLARAHPDL